MSLEPDPPRPAPRWRVASALMAGVGVAALWTVLGHAVGVPSNPRDAALLGLLAGGAVLWLRRGGPLAPSATHLPGIIGDRDDRRALVDPGDASTGYLWFAAVAAGLIGGVPFAIGIWGLAVGAPRALELLLMSLVLLAIAAWPIASLRHRLGERRRRSEAARRAARDGG